MIPSAPRADGSAVFPSPVEALLAAHTLPLALQPSETVGFDARPSRSYAATGPFIPATYTKTNYPRRRFISGLDVFLAFFFFVVPLGLGIFYFGFYAANQYISEFRFNVIDTSAPAPAMAGGLASVLGGAGLGSGSTDSYTVTDFLISPQAVVEVEKKIPIRKIFSNPKADWLYRLDPKTSQEKLNWFWPWMVSSYFDPVTGIASAQVRAFTADDAYLVSSTLLKAAEKLVNDMQARQRSDTIRFAQEALDRDNAHLSSIRGQMLVLRKDSGYIEPSASGVAENTTLATNLRLSIVSQTSQLNALKGVIKNSNAPMIKSLSENIAASKDQLALIDKEISSHDNASPGHLASVVGKFDELNAEQVAATAMMTSDLITLQQARAQADAQHIYLSTYVYPTLPTSSTYPYRPMGIALTILAAFGLFCFAKLVATAIQSHAV